MTMSAVLAIIMVLAWMGGACPAEVPPTLLGYWEGTTMFSGKNCLMSMLVTGLTETHVGMVYTIFSKSRNCVHEIRFIKREDRDVIEAVADNVMLSNGACYPMQIRIVPIGANKIVADWTWLDDDGDIIDSSSSLMERVDNGQLTKKLSTCEPETDISPLAKLKKKLDQNGRSKEPKGG